MLQRTNKAGNGQETSKPRDLFLVHKSKGCSRVSNGSALFVEKIDGRRFFETNNIPNNLGGGTNESLVILVDASEIVMGDVQQVSVDRTNTATVQNDGVDTSLFEHDIVTIRLRQWNDLILRHDVSTAVIEAVKWGA